MLYLVLFFAVSMLLFGYIGYHFISKRKCRKKSARRIRIKPSNSPIFRNAKKPDWVTQEIIRLKAALPGYGCRKIADQFNLLYAATQTQTVGKSFVADVFRKHAYDILQLRKKWKHRIPCKPPNNKIWGLDLCGKQDIDGNQWAILGIIDHGSRLNLVLEAIAKRNAWIILGIIFITMGRYGKQSRIRTDNESMFTGKVFGKVLTLFNIRHERTLPHHPWQNGRIERLFLTLKQPLDQISISGQQQLSTLLFEFRVWYNCLRPHQHLNGATPMDAWNRINPFRTPYRSVHYVELWEGRLTGFYLRRE